MARDKNKTRILITGGTGFLGSYAITYYSSHGYTVRALVRKKSGEKLQNKSLDIELAYGDIRDKKSLLEATKNVDFIINFAALKSDEKDSYDVNVKGMEYLIDASKQNNVSKIIQISTISTKIKKRGVYGETKAQADRLIRKSTIPYVILRPSIVYGDLKNGIFGSLVKATNLPVIPLFGDGQCYFYPIQVEDLIKATEIAMLNKRLTNKSYDVGGPDKITFNELVYILAKKKEKKPIIFHIPALFGIVAAAILSKIFYYPPVTVSNILGSTQIVSIDVQTFFRDFHFKPRSLSKGLSELFAKSDNRLTESKLFFSYILPKKYSGNLSVHVYERYITALQKNNITFYKHIPRYFPYILGPLDAFSKICFPDSHLQKKVLITAALIETIPDSADWLLPKTYATGRIIVKITKLFTTTAIKFIFGFLLFFIPGLYKKYVI